MRRSLCLVLAVIVAISSAAVSSPHVHAYGGHEHPEHQHGPASHRHEHHHGSPAAAAAPATAPAPSRDHHDHRDAHHGDGHDDGSEGASVRIEGVRASLRFEACDAGDHAIRIPGAAAPAAHAQVQLAVLAGSIVVPPVAPARFALAPLDVRVHGPPADTRLPARAPPLTSPA